MRINNKKAIDFILLLLTTWIIVGCSNSQQSEREYNSYNIYSSLLYAEPSELFLGNINRAKKPSIPFTFDIISKSSENISIEKVDVSCNCVKVVKFPKHLNAGEVGRLSGEIDLRNQSGHIRKSIYINYCDTCITVLKIVADITD